MVADNLFLYFSLLICFYFLATHLLHMIQNLPPSPFPALPLIGHLYLFKKPLYRTLAKISAKHGPVILLNFGSRPVLVVSSSSAAEECLTKNDVVFANRPRLLAGKYFGYNYTSLAWSSYGYHWRNLRRIASLEILSTHRLHLLSNIRSDEVRSLIRCIAKRSTEGSDRTVEMKSALFELSMNVMMRMIAGKRYYGENLMGVEEAMEFKEIVMGMLQIGGATNIGDFVPLLRWLGISKLEKKMAGLQKSRNRFMRKLIDEATRTMGDNFPKSEAGGGRKMTLIEVLLRSREEEPEYYTDDMINSIMLVLLTAGTDTSAATMEWALSLLVNHPEVLEKAQKEIDGHVSHGRLLEESDLANLPYLHRIITETLRMYPAAPLLIPHSSAEQCQVGGCRVPRNTMLLINLWAIQNDPENWEEPAEFKPERFEDLRGERDGFNLMPFGSGRRSCPGEALATRIVGLTIGSLIQCFEWERVGEEMVDMTEGVGLTLPRAHPLVVKCQPREHLADLLCQL